MNPLEQQIAEAVSTVLPIDPGSDTARALARVVAEVLPKADVSDEALLAALRPVECVPNPYGEGYMALGEDAEQVLPAVRTLLDAQTFARPAPHDLTADVTDAQIAAALGYEDYGYWWDADGEYIAHAEFDGYWRTYSTAADRTAKRLVTAVRSLLAPARDADPRIRAARAVAQDWRTRVGTAPAGSFIREFADDIDNALDAKGCIGCVIDGRDHSCGYVEPMRPERGAND
jgi:hypothetical protein